jgi:hypothetical protein
LESELKSMQAALEQAKEQIESERSAHEEKMHTLIKEHERKQAESVAARKAPDARITELEKELEVAKTVALKQAEQLAEMEAQLESEKRMRKDAEAEAQAARAAADNLKGREGKDAAADDRARNPEQARIHESLEAELKDAKKNRDQALELAFRNPRKKRKD